MNARRLLNDLLMIVLGVIGLLIIAVILSL